MGKRKRKREREAMKQPTEKVSAARRYSGGPALRFSLEASDCFDVWEETPVGKYFIARFSGFPAWGHAAAFMRMLVESVPGGVGHMEAATPPGGEPLEFLNDGGKGAPAAPAPEPPTKLPLDDVARRVFDGNEPQTTPPAWAYALAPLYTTTITPPCGDQGDPFIASAADLPGLWGKGDTSLEALAALERSIPTYLYHYWLISKGGLPVPGHNLAEVHAAGFAFAIAQR